MKKGFFIFIFIFISIALVAIWVVVWDFKFMQETATYWNFDVPWTISWIEKMQPWLLKDYASSKVYWEFNGHPLKFILILFVIMFLLQFVRLKWDYFVRRLSQFTMFVIARLWVLRVSWLCPIKRTEFWVLPVLNCQSCEMATWWCPIWMIQASLVNWRFPFLFLWIVWLVWSLTWRLICWWICPFGLFLDTFWRILTIKKIKYKIKLSPYFRYIKFWLLAWIFTAFLWTIPIFCIYICQAANIYWYLPYYLTTWLEWYKLMLNWTIFSYLFWFHISSAILLVLLIITLGWRWFCKFVCPLGAFYWLF